MESYLGITWPLPTQKVASVIQVLSNYKGLILSEGSIIKLKDNLVKTTKVEEQQ